MSETAAFKVEGLREFQAALRAVEDGLQKELRGALNSAAEVVATEARRKVPRRSGRAAASVKAQSSQREAKVIGGSKKAAYYPWLDFGGRIGRDRATRRPYVQGGRYLFPAFASTRNEVLTALGEAIEDLVRRSGLEIEHG